VRRARIFALPIALVAACGTDTPPVPGEITVAITSPAPGAELLESEDPTIVVTGTVATTSPDFGTLECWLDGSRIELAADGSFSAEITPELGVNHIKVEGGDGINPLIGQQLDVMWAPDYLPPIAGTTGFDLTNAIELRLGQKFFDGRLFGTTLDLSTDPVVARDLGSALELILWHIDLATLLPGGLVFGSGSASINVAIPSATPSGILVDARVVDDPVHAIDLTIDLTGVFLAMNGTFVFGNTTMQVQGGIAADMHATARLTPTVLGDGTVDVGVSNVTAVVGPLVPAFTGPDGDELDAFIEIGNSDFRTVIEGLISSQLIPTFTDKIPPLLETLLGATDSLLDNLSFALDPGLGNPVMLTLDGGIAGLDLVAGPAIGTQPGHTTVRQNLTIRTGNVPVHGTSRGAIRLATAPPPPTTLTSGVYLIMRQEFLNSLLHTLWNSGLLEGEATFGGLVAGVSAKLAPVVRPTPPSSLCEIDGVRCDVLITLGQVEVSIPDFEQTFGVNATAGARIVVEGTKVSLVIQEVPELIVWETSPVPGTLTPIAISDLIKNLVWPELFGAIGDNLSIELPLPNLADLGLSTLGPGLANAELKLTVRQQPDVTAGFLTLGADLELATPPPP
jgi:hypothetical protein